MYLPEHDEVTDAQVLQEFIAAHPLAHLVTHDGQSPSVDFIPLLWHAEHADAPASPAQLIGHVARANQLWQPGRQRGPVLAVFGPVDHYVSPTWYPSKAEHHRTVPTWNYLTVQVQGELIVHDDPAWTRAAVARLTRHLEQGQPQPWRMGQAPPDYLAEMVEKIVGIAIRIESVTGKFKVSAARSEADRHGAREGIRRQGGPSELVEAMNPRSSRA